MSDTFYNKGREGFLDGTISWTTNNIKVVLVDTGQYTLDAANHQNLSDIPSGARIATSGNLTGKTATSGVADADDLTFTGVSGASIEALVIYKDTGTASTSRLIVYRDNVTGFPVTPNGGDLTLTWANDANKVFKL